MTDNLSMKEVLRLTASDGCSPEVAMTDRAPDVAGLVAKVSDCLWVDPLRDGPMDRRLRECRDALLALQAEVARLTDENRTFQEIIGSDLQSYQTIKAERDRLAGENADQKHDIDRLMETNQEILTENTRLREENARLEGEVAALRDYVARHGNPVVASVASQEDSYLIAHPILRVMHSPEGARVVIASVYPPKEPPR